MDLERLYNVSPLEGREDSLDRAVGADNRTAIEILTDYLRWTPEGLQAQVPQGAEPEGVHIRT